MEYFKQLCVFLFPAAASLLLIHSQLKICMGTSFAESSRNCLPAHSFHLLPGAECFQIFRNLPNVLWEPSP